MLARTSLTPAAFALLALFPAAAIAADDTQALKEQIRRLEARLAALESQERPAPAVAASPARGEIDKRLAIVERKQELSEEDAKSKAEKTPVVEMGKKGFSVTSADKQFGLKIRGYAQFDQRSFLNDDANTGRNEFLARRIRPVLEFTAYKDFSFRLMPDFAGSSTRIFDAHADYKLYDELQFRVGKFKPPVGLERLQSAADIFFIERGHPTNLAPTRDYGAMIYGDLLPQTIEYQLGLFNGTSDLGNADGDGDDRKDIVARIFTHPFAKSDLLSLQGLGLGLAGSYGEREGSTGSTLLGDYRSPGQQAFFRYRSSTATPAQNSYADGTHWRLYPQGYYYNNNYGLMAEYAVSDQEVSRLANHDSFQITAWQVAGSYVLTGENVNFRGSIKPDKNLDPSHDGWGAVELIARVGENSIDRSAFPNFADIAVSARKAASYGGGINWYLNENVKLAVNYDHTRFTGGAAGGADRPDEHALFTRTQFRF